MTIHATFFGILHMPQKCSSRGWEVCPDVYAKKNYNLKFVYYAIFIIGLYPPGSQNT
jgi:hypothetical protein